MEKRNQELNLEKQLLQTMVQTRNDAIDKLKLELGVANAQLRKRSEE